MASKQIILTQDELSLLVSAVNIVNQQNEQAKQLTAELQRNKAIFTAIWKSIYQRWQLDNIEERASMPFQVEKQFRIENGSIFIDD